MLLGVVSFDSGAPKFEGVVAAAVAVDPWAGLFGGVAVALAAGKLAPVSDLDDPKGQKKNSTPTAPAIKRSARTMMLIKPVLFIVWTLVAHVGGSEGFNSPVL